MEQNNKPYKACNPLVTINTIRNILTDCNIFLLEKYHEVSSNFYSSRLIVSGNGIEKLYKGTNGKGLTPLFSLASAYAEFMERIQNYYIFNEALVYAKKHYQNNARANDLGSILNDNNLMLDFEYDPNEKYQSFTGLSDHELEILKDISRYNDNLNNELNSHNSESRKHLFAPFYCLNSNQTEYLPIQLLLSKTGSNGMCAGNTKKEALIQGFCEIFERYVAKKIFEEELTPPTIPLETFKGTQIYDLAIQLMKDNNLSIHIKDCSLNIGLPVIGLLIIDYDSNSYTFNLGADPSPTIALQRCFTEMYQGDQYKQLLRKIDFVHDPYGSKETGINQRKNAELLKFVLKGDGKFPISILKNSFSYDFEGLNWNQNKSDDDDLRFIVNKIKEMEKNLYIRDVSFLGFPSFYIYVPGMSEIIYPFAVAEEKVEPVISNNNFNRALFYHIKNRSNQEYLSIARHLENDSSDSIMLFPYNISDENRVNKYYLLSLIYYKISDYEKSYSYLNSLIESSVDEISNNTYFYCTRDYIYMKSTGMSNQEIATSLSIVYPESLLIEVISDLDNNNDIFSYQNYSSCFNCKSCKISSECRYIDVIKIVKSIQEKHIASKIKQADLGEIFSHICQ